MLGMRVLRKAVGLTAMPQSLPANMCPSLSRTLRKGGSAALGTGLLSAQLHRLRDLPVNLVGHLLLPCFIPCAALGHIVLHV